MNRYIQSAILHQMPPLIRFDEDAAEELLDFRDTFSGCIDSLIETLEELRDTVCGIDVPNIEPFPEPELMPDPKGQISQGELPF